ncbi:MAG: PQQ-dependent sugar dehydrogenase [Candidatus Competibacterales bacterium]
MALPHQLWEGHLAPMALSLVLLGSEATASLEGRSGFSGNPAINGGAVCSACHQPDPQGPTALVTIAGPEEVDAGSTHFYTITIAGGRGGSAGLAVSTARADAGTPGVGVLAPLDDDLRLFGGELVHIAPVAFANGRVTFGFTWTAPPFSGPVALFVAANASDGNLDLLGDAIATTTLPVTVVNGTPPPPPPAPPPAPAISAVPHSEGFAAPVAIAHAGDERLFVVEQEGRIQVLAADGTPLAEPFLDIAEGVVSGGELGLLGLAFHPDFAANGRLFVYYTTDEGGRRSRVSEFAVSADPNRVDPASERVLLTFAQPFSNHNAGDIHFGLDGYLYIASGDGGAPDPAQDPGSLLGKILRLDVDGLPAALDGPDCHQGAGPAGYRIPGDNLYRDGVGGAGCDEIFAMGVRNPWRMAFDRLTGELWIADVGENRFEEINRLPGGGGAGLNLGWPCREGFALFDAAECDAIAPAAELDAILYAPRVALGREEGNCSITGGRVYRGVRYPDLQGRYFFSDFCNSAIRTLSEGPQGPVIDQLLPAGVVPLPATFGEDSVGELYVSSLETGTIYRLESPVDLGVDSDGDGIPDAIEPLVGTDPGVRDNDVFTDSLLYVRQLYRDILGREGDAPGIDHWTNQIASGLQTRADMGLTFVVSGEFLAGVSERFPGLDLQEVQVQALYEGMLQRLPDPPGFAYWVGRFRDGAPVQDLVQAFLDAEEYRRRFLP